MLINRPQTSTHRPQLPTHPRAGVAAPPPPGVSAASGAPHARRRVLARVGRIYLSIGGTAAAGAPGWVPAP